ncbi:MAG: SH3 domain-containing protein [Turneriella sp.]|nr:SH3 domain-containing protein [Turneriella sp.]
MKKYFATYVIPLLLSWAAMQCKERQDATPAFDKPAAPAATAEAKPDGAGGKRWVWSSDGVILREEPNRSSKQLALVPRGEEIDVLSAAAAPPVADTVGGEAGHWVKANLKGKVGWVFDVFLSSPPGPNALEYGSPYTIKAEGYSEQSFTFAADGSVKYIVNHCEGYGTHNDKFTVRKGQVYFKEGAGLTLEIHGKTSLLMPKEAEQFTCSNVTGAATFEVKKKS